MWRYSSLTTRLASVVQGCCADETDGRATMMATKRAFRNIHTPLSRMNGRIRAATAGAAYTEPHGWACGGTPRRARHHERPRGDDGLRDHLCRAGRALDVAAS